MTLPDKIHLAVMKKNDKNTWKKRLSKRNLLDHERNDIDENEEFMNNSYNFFCSKRNKQDPLDFTTNLLLVDEIKQESFVSNFDEDSQGKSIF